MSSHLNLKSDQGDYSIAQKAHGIKPSEPQGFDYSVPLGNSFPLAHGGFLKNVHVECRLIGPKGSPVIAVLGGISASKNVAEEKNVNGWWQIFAGPGKPLDTEKFQILGIDYIYSKEGASISTKDQAGALKDCLDYLSLPYLDFLVGSSYGAMVSLAFAEQFPTQVKELVLISGSHQPHPMATARRSIQRQILKLGMKTGYPKEALAIARGLAMTTYRSEKEFEKRFARTPTETAGEFCFPVEEYLQEHGNRCQKTMTPEKYLALSESIDLHGVSPENITTPATIIAFFQDQVVPVKDMRDLAKRYKGKHNYYEYKSVFGHDAFLKEKAMIGGLLKDIVERDWNV